ncbi:alpha/beta hydrolase [Streptomyces sp. NBC_01232]|uniref:alpha/beta hydrolase n=1 Tax=Streptomyces sp. NBC_01232 TaxID=2903786 RepID=UPI002E112E0B|nr:alpha/beta hydrolase [Streptomyces sp. NBC_01232]
MTTTALDLDYSPSSLVADLDRYLARYADDSARARATLRVHRGLPCGPLPEQRLDLFPAAEPGAPLMVFVHGGYWQELSRSEAAFAAADFVAAGISFAALGYGLAPRYRMRAITAMAADSVRRICAGRAELPGAPSAVHLAGHSAGAHLVASALLDTAGWRAAGTDAAAEIASATLISGVYELEPLTRTYVNDALGMDAQEAREVSPLHRLTAGAGSEPGPVPGPGALPPLVIARGIHETDAFGRQQAAFAGAVRAAVGPAADVNELVVAGRHHFDLPFDLGRPDTVLGAAVARAARFQR